MNRPACPSALAPYVHAPAGDLELLGAHPIGHADGIRAIATIEASRRETRQRAPSDSALTVTLPFGIEARAERIPAWHATVGAVAVAGIAVLAARCDGGIHGC